MTTYFENTGALKLESIALQVLNIYQAMQMLYVHMYMHGFDFLMGYMYS